MTSSLSTLATCRTAESVITELHTVPTAQVGCSHLLAQLRHRIEVQVVERDDPRATVALVVADGVDETTLRTVRRLHRERGLSVVLIIGILEPHSLLSIVEAGVCAALPRADFVSIHCPKNPETVGMFNAARLARMKPGAFLVNTARGGIIDEPALYAALTSGRLAGAGLDVFEMEPTPVNNTLLQLDTVITSPHMAGVTTESVAGMARVTAENILSVLDGRPNRDNVINQEVLDRT